MIGGASVVAGQLESYRRELTGYCYRMLGSGFEAEDAVQEIFVRAWRHADSFEGRSTIRTWLYRIATNVCIDMARQVQRRARPMELSPPSPADESHLGTPLLEVAWVTPIPDAAVRPDSDDPADIAEHRESIRLAFVTALQHLAPRQRAAVVLCDVLRWRAAEVAELLDTSVASANSALQRARAKLDAQRHQMKPARLDPAGGLAPWAIQVLEIRDGRIAQLSFFLDLFGPRRLFPAFGLPTHLGGDDRRPRLRPASRR